LQKGRASSRNQSQEAVPANVFHWSFDMEIKQCKVISFLIAFLFCSLTLATAGYSAQVSLAWDPNGEPDLSGYTLYYGTSSGNYTDSVWLGLVTSYTVTNLSDGVAYYFALTASNSGGLVSGFSNEVSYNPANPANPPASQFSLTVYTAGTGGGTVTGSPAGTIFNPGTQVSLTAAADANSRFTGWSGACSGTANPCRVTMNANTQVTASFAVTSINQSASYTLRITKNGSGKGVVVNTPSGSSFKSGTVVTLTSTPDAGSVFSGWSGACKGTSDTCTVTMSARRSVYATFNLKTNPGSLPLFKLYLPAVIK
jgi:Divergent InlB B-repeat domain/Fibronectin type III domain